MNKITPVILSGGSGTRLWPLSRKSRPKQFLALSSNNTMFQETLLRLDSKIVSDNPVVICNEEHRFMVAEQLRQLNITARNIVLEPVGRNTAPALTIASILSNPDEILLVLPSDHVIKDKEAFHQALAQAQPLAEAGNIVTFGVVPTHAETGYGYIHAKETHHGDSLAIINFVEKPDAKTAQQYVDSGHYFWNSGIFMFKASKLLEEIECFRPDILTACKQALTLSAKDMDFLRLDVGSFGKCPSVSIDYALMEKTDNAIVIPLDADWNDLGLWTSVWKAGEKDASDNVIKGDVIQKASRNCYLHSEHRLVSALGLDNIIIVETSDSLMVAHADHVQDIKELVAKIKANDRNEAENHREVYRPWGKYDSIDAGPGYQVKRITVNPGAKLSVQRHQYRSEHWVIVKGYAKIVIDGVEQLLSTNQSTYVPAKSIHSLENTHSEPLEMIEIQSGSYLGEDDIERLEDIYGRE